MATKTARMDEEATRQTLAARAYAIWESEGRPHGRDVEHWKQAEAETTAPRARRATSKTAPKSGAKVPPKVAAAMSAAVGETRTTRATSKTKKSPTGTGKKR